MTHISCYSNSLTATTVSSTLELIIWCDCFLLWPHNLAALNWRLQLMIETSREHCTVTCDLWLVKYNCKQTKTENSGDQTALTALTNYFQRERQIGRCGIISVEDCCCCCQCCCHLAVVQMKRKMSSDRQPLENQWLWIALVKQNLGPLQIKMDQLKLLKKVD